MRPLLDALRDAPHYRKANRLLATASREEVDNAFIALAEEPENHIHRRLLKAGASLGAIEISLVKAVAVDNYTLVETIIERGISSTMGVRAFWGTVQHDSTLSALSIIPYCSSKIPSSEIAVTFRDGYKEAVETGKTGMATLLFGMVNLQGRANAVAYAMLKGTEAIRQAIVEGSATEAERHEAQALTARKSPLHSAMPSTFGTTRPHSILAIMPTNRTDPTPVPEPETSTLPSTPEQLPFPFFPVVRARDERHEL